MIRSFMSLRAENAIIRAARGTYSCESTQIVTGPSFTSETFIDAPNTPVWTGMPSASKHRTKDSYQSFA